MGIQILVDSCCDTTPQLREQIGMLFAPLKAVSSTHLQRKKGLSIWRRSCCCISRDGMCCTGR